MKHPGRTKAEILAGRRRDTAFHESGHAVASLMLSLPFTEVHIIPGAPGDASDHLGMLVKEPEEVSIQDPASELEDRCLHALVGPAAEAYFRRRLEWKFGSDDFNVAFDFACMRHVNGTMAEVEAFLKYVWVRANEFIRRPHHWRAISAVAEALVEKDRLTFKETQEIVIRAMEGKWVLRADDVLVFRQEHRDDDSDRLRRWLVRHALRRAPDRPGE